MHQRDRENAYAIGALEMTIRLAVHDLERGQSLVALARLKSTLETWKAQAKYYVEHVAPLPTT